MADSPAIHIDALLQHSAWLKRLARDLVGHPDQAEDLVHETWRKALEEPPRDGADLRGWLGTILRRIAVDRRREAAARDWHERSASRSEAWSPEDIEYRVVLQRRLAEAVQGLEEPFRTAITLHYLEEMPEKEIALRQGISYEAVRKRIERGRDKLRGRLDREYGDREAWCGIVVLLLRKGTPGPITGSTIAKVAAVAVAVAALPILAVLVWNTLRSGSSPSRAQQTAAAEIPLAPPPGTSTPAARSPSARQALTAPARPEERSTGLHGLVLDPLGNPIDGARVTAFADEQSGYDWEPDAPVVRRQVAETRTDALGAFALGVAPYRPYDLEVAAQGFATALFGPRYSGEAVTVRLDAGAVLGGRAVQASDGKPVAGALLDVTTLEGTLEGRALRLRQGATDADGRFRFADLPAIPVFLKIRPVSGGAPRSLQVVLAAGDAQELDLKIEPGLTVRGRVLDADTLEPIANAEVGEVWNLQEFGRVDEYGAYACSGIRGTGVVALQARARGYAADTRVFRADAGVDDLPESLDFPLSRGLPVRGRLLDSTGKPVVDGLVEVVSDTPIHPSIARAARIRGRTDARGRFELPDASRKLALTLLARNEGSGALVRPCPAPSPGANVLELGDVFLPPASIVRGTVVDDGGHPLPDVAVVLHDQADLSLLRRLTERSARTDDKGRFAFADLAAGEFRVEVRLPDGSIPAGRDVSVAPGSGVEDVQLALRTLGSISGRVTYADGEALERVVVMAGAEDEDTRHAALTDANGSFRINGLAPGTHRIEIVAGGSGGRAYLGQERANVTPGSEDLLIVLETAALLHGKVVDAEERAVGNAAVFARAPGREDVFRAITNADGTFSIPVPLGVSVNLEAYPPGEKCPVPPLPSGAAAESEHVARGHSVLPTDSNVILKFPR